MSTTNHGLILRGSTWHMRFTIKGQHVAESTHTSNRREAERILAKRRTELVEQVVLGGKKPIKLHDGLDLFLASRRHLPSHQNLETHVRYFREMSNHTLDRITDMDIETLLHKKRAEGYAESTLKVSITYFNTMIKYLNEQGYTVRKKLKAIKHDSRRLRWLTKDEYASLLVELNPNISTIPKIILQKQENIDLIHLLYQTGARYTEISEMSWIQVDFTAGTVFIKRKKGSVSGTIRMTKVMREVLERRRKLESGDLVFSSKKNTQSEGLWFKNAVKRAGIDLTQGKITVHTIRHTRCCHLIQAGLGLLELQKFVGHKSIESTLVYAMVTEDLVMQRVAELTDA